MNSYKRQTGMKLWGSRRAGRGQSLVEFALTLPVLLTILAGVLEVANLLMVYNRVQIAAREGARFGAAGGDDAGVMTVVRQSSTESLAVEDDQMRVWVIRPVINYSGGAWSWQAPTTENSWEDPVPAPPAKPLVAQCVFPATGCTADDVVPLVSPTTVLNEIESMGSSADAQSVSGTRFVIVVVSYRSDMILNLPWWGTNADGTGRFPMFAYAILRQEVEQTAITQKGAGCSAYPIALSHTQISGANSKSEGDQFTVQVNDEFAVTPRKDGFRFLTWNISTAGNIIEPAYLQNPVPGGPPLPPGTRCNGTLWFPGSSIGCEASQRSYLEPGGTDTTLHMGNWVAYHTADPGDVSNPLTNANYGHFNGTPPRALRIIIYTYVDNAGIEPNPQHKDGMWQYRIGGYSTVTDTNIDAGVNNPIGFAIVRLIGSPSADSLTFEWVKTDNSCGNP